MYKLKFPKSKKNGYVGQNSDGLKIRRHKQAFKAYWLRDAPTGLKLKN
jgi:hypothetical protein